MPQPLTAIRYLYSLLSIQHNSWISLPNTILCNVLSYTTNGLRNTAKPNCPDGSDEWGLCCCSPCQLRASLSVPLALSGDKGYILSFMAAQHSDDAVN